MSAEFNAENRNAGILPTRRCCSFCRNTGHNISTCNNTRLLDFEQLCLTRKASLGIAEFRNWLLNYSIENPNIVKAYAVRYCGCSIRSYMHVCVSHILERINRLNETSLLNSNREHSAEFNQRLRRSEENLLGLAELRNRLGSPTRENLTNINLQDNISRGDLIAAVEFFRNFINSVYEEAIQNRKFNIQTNLVECSQTNHCECDICYESKLKPEFVKLNCGHEFCKDCIKQSLKNVRTENPQCAFCRSEIVNMELTSQEICNEFNDLINTSV
jgi:hypothetical protein